MSTRSVFLTPGGSVRSPWRIPFFIAAFIACSFAAAALVSPIVGGAFTALGLRSETFASIVEVVAALAATALALRWMDKRPWSDVGLDPQAAKPMKLGTGFSIGAVAIAAPILLLIIVGWLDRVPATTLDWGHPIIRMTVLLLPAALAEELITRGYILTALRDALGWPWAVALTSIGFGLLHLQNPGSDATSVVLVALAGVFLAVVRIATGSLYAAWMAHFAWNWVMAAVFHAPVSGFAFDAPGYRYVDAGPDWATGGAWGPEGGVPAGLAMITGTGLLLLWMRRGKADPSLRSG